MNLLKKQLKKEWLFLPITLFWIIPSFLPILLPRDKYPKFTFTVIDRDDNKPLKEGYLLVHFGRTGETLIKPENGLFTLPPENRYYSQETPIIVYYIHPDYQDKTSVIFTHIIKDNLDYLKYEDNTEGELILSDFNSHDPEKNISWTLKASKLKNYTDWNPESADISIFPFSLFSLNQEYGLNLDLNHLQEKWKAIINSYKFSKENEKIWIDQLNDSIQTTLRIDNRIAKDSHTAYPFAWILFFIFMGLLILWARIQDKKTHCLIKLKKIFL